jgi:sulfonate transport system ATP-binding protein
MIDSDHFHFNFRVIRSESPLPLPRLTENVAYGRASRLGLRRKRSPTDNAFSSQKAARDAPAVRASSTIPPPIVARMELARQPQLLLADEPFGALDALSRIRMHDLLRRLCERHRPTVLLITHDVDEAIYLAQRVLVLDHAATTVDLPESSRERAARLAEIRTYLLGELEVRSGLCETA